MQLLSIRLLGEFSAVDHRGNTLSVGNKRTQALVIYLALKIGGRPTLREAGELGRGRPGADQTPPRAERRASAESQGEGEKQSEPTTWAPAKQSACEAGQREWR